MGELIQKQYAFVLGREVELAKTELEAVMNRFGFCFGEFDDCFLDEEDEFSGNHSHGGCLGHYTLSLNGNIALINIESSESLDPKKLIADLGGTVKIFEIVGPRSEKLSGQIFELIFAKKAGESKKFNYGISSYDRRLARNDINKIGLEVKRLFEGTLKSRFVALREGSELSSIVSLKNKLVSEGVEAGVFNKDIGVLVALSDPEEWSRRDYDKPAGDKRSGMVPPKLARMMVNIALNQESGFGFQDPGFGSVTRNPQPATCLVVDPFCGSGNILMEAMLLGCDVAGSDVSEKAVNDTRANVAWLIEQYQTNVKFKLGVADATKEDFSGFFDCHSERCGVGVKNPSVGERSFGRGLLQDDNRDIVVVTEPYLGEPKKFAPSQKAAHGEYSKIKETYLSFLKNIRTLRLSDSRPLTLCIIFPLVETSDKGKFSLYQDSVDEIRKLGYTELRTPLRYGREYQVVKRQIVFLRF